MARDGSVPPTAAKPEGGQKRHERDHAQSMQFGLRMWECGESSFESYAIKIRVWGRYEAFLQSASLPPHGETLSKPRSPTNLFSWL